MAEVLGTTDLHTIGVGSSILPFATNESFFLFHMPRVV